MLEVVHRFSSPGDRLGKRVDFWYHHLNLNEFIQEWKSEINSEQVYSLGCSSRSITTMNMLMIVVVFSGHGIEVWSIWTATMYGFVDLRRKQTYTACEPRVRTTLQELRRVSPSALFLLPFSLFLFFLYIITHFSLSFGSSSDRSIMSRQYKEMTISSLFISIWISITLGVSRSHSSFSDQQVHLGNHHSFTSYRKCARFRQFDVANHMLRISFSFR